MLAIYKLPHNFFLESFLYIKTWILNHSILVYKRAFPSIGFDYWAAYAGGAADQNKRLLPEPMSLPINDLS